MVQFPNLQFVQNSLSIDPSGSRHLNGAGFIKVLGTGAGEVLDYGQLNTTGSGAITPTKLCYARVTDFADASGIFNMRFFLVNTTAWGAGTYRFLEKKDVTFVPNLTLDSSARNTPTTVPSNTNVSGTVQPEWSYGSPWISGTIPHDQGVTEYIWLATEVGVNVEIGQKGGAGAGTWRFRLIYDFS